MDLSREAPESTSGVVVTRGGLVESAHHVDVAVTDADGRLLFTAGDWARVVFLRSAAKPLQALPLVEDGVTERLAITDEELALCCASHSGEARHVEAARSILAKAGLDEAALACGPHPPLRQEEAERLLATGWRPSAVHNNCSGKHAGMLALAVVHGWPTQAYEAPAHPVQLRMLAEVSRWSGLDAEEIGKGVDGCGVVSFAVPLQRAAAAFARFARAAGRGEPAALIVGTMARHAFMVGGTGRLCTVLMERVGERIFVKTGAEGVYCAGVPGRGLGVALKVRDGARRAADVALLHVLDALGVLEPEELAELDAFAKPTVWNTRGEAVGEVRAVLRLEPAG